MKLLVVLVICLMLPVLAFSQEKIDLKMMTGQWEDRGILWAGRLQS